MKKRYNRQELEKLEREMKDSSLWEKADHVVRFRGPTSIRFSEDLLTKLHAIAKARKKPLNRLVNEYVKPFVEGEYSLLQNLK